MSVLADRAVALVAHLLIDAESDALLESLIRGLLDPADLLSLIAHGDDTRDPIDVLIDPARAELSTIEHAVQWTGGTTPTRLSGETDDAYLARARIAGARPRAIRRGSVAGLIDIGRPFLVDTMACRVIEDTDTGTLNFVARTGAVSDIDALEQALNDPEVVAAGWKVDVVETDAPTINEWTLPINDVHVHINALTLEDVT